MLLFGWVKMFTDAHKFVMIHSKDLTEYFILFI